jgi:hypothetical protein
MKKFIAFIAFFLIAVTPGVSHATKFLASGSNAQCPMVETANITITLNGNDKGIDQIKPMLDAKGKEIETIAADLQAGKLELQNFSYSVYMNNNGGVSAMCGAENIPQQTYQYNASFSYVMTPGEKAADLTALLASKGYNVSMNVNAYRQCQ